MRLFDTHAHLTDERFTPDREALVLSLPEKDVGLVVDVVCDVRGAADALTITRTPFIYAAVGMHPHVAAETTWAHLDELSGLLRHPKVVALGEIGLDYHYDFAPRDVQKKWFAAQLELAQQLNLPVSLHIREAFGDCMDVLRANKQGLQGVMHCFSGSPEIARECVDLGLYVAFGGSLTFKNAAKLPEAAKALPLERILLETDCPYMTPEPFRGRRNDPSYTRFVAAKLAQFRGTDIETIAAATYENGKRLFKIEEK